MVKTTKDNWPLIFISIFSKDTSGSYAVGLFFEDVGASILTDRIRTKKEAQRIALMWRRKLKRGLGTAEAFALLHRLKSVAEKG